MDCVEKDDVKEAMRLMEMCKDSLKQNDPGMKKGRRMVDIIYDLIRSMADGAKTLKIQEIKDRATTKGYTPGQLDEALDEYEQLDVWQLNQARTKLTFVN